MTPRNSQLQIVNPSLNGSEKSLLSSKPSWLFLRRSLVVALCLVAVFVGVSTYVFRKASAAPGDFTSKANSPAPLTAVAVDPNTGLIYAQQNGGTAFYRYSPSANSWVSLAACPINSGNNGGAVYLNGKIYTNYTTSTSMGVYTIASDSWTTIGSLLNATGNITSDGTNLYLAVGTTFVRFNPATNAATTLAASSIAFTQWGGLAFSNGFIYGHGGNNTTGFAKYNISTNTWTTLASVPGGAALGSAIDPVGNAYYAYGPYSGSNWYKFDLTAETWSSITFPLASGLNDGGIVYAGAGTATGIYMTFGEGSTGFGRLETNTVSISLNSDATVAEPATGTTAATFNVTLGQATAQTVTVDYATANGTALAGSDYTATSGTLTFAPGETNKAINVIINSDMLTEVAETFTVNLSNAVNATISDAQGIGTIRQTLSGNGKIAFNSRRDGNLEIYSMNSDGSGQTRLTNNLANDELPMWSPDGSKIVFASNRGGNLDIYSMNADGTNQTRLTTDAANDYYPAWSPDGSKISFNSSRDGNSEIYVMNADGSNQINITNIAGHDEESKWSPDGSKIVFGSRRDAGNYEIYTMNADGSNQTRLTTTSAAEEFPSWSPDGSKIAFYTNRDGNDEIYLMNPDGSGQTRITNNAAADYFPTWSPDGTKITFSANRDGNLEIYTMNPDGSNQTRLTNVALDDYFSSWQPVAVSNGTIQFQFVNSSSNESATTRLVDVTRTGGSDNTVAINYATADGTAIAGSDYTATSGTLVFNQGETSKQISITVLNDSVYELQESFALNLSSPTGGATLGTPATHTLVVSDNDPQPQLAINVIAVIEPLSGTTTATFTVTLTGATTVPATVNYATADVTAIAPGDYVATSGTLTFNVGETSKNIAVTINSDNITEALETFRVNLSGVTNATYSNTFGVGTIRQQYSNGKIAFNSTRDGGDLEIYTMNADGSGQTRITNITGRDELPFWSPDGSKLIFASNRGASWDVYIMNADGTGQTNLTNHPATDNYPAMSPDGTKITFASNRDGNNEVYVMNADGTGQTNLTNNSGHDEEAKFSPNGSKIVFTSRRDAGNYEIYSMNADGSNQTRLTNNPTIEEWAAWSPDGSKIVFESNRDGNFEIYLMNPDGTGQTRLTNNAANDEEPTWSPDGTKITFSSNRDGNLEVYTMNPDGTNQTRLTNVAGDDYLSSWQPVSLTPGTLQFSTATYSVNENGATATITVTRAGGSDGAIGVSYATANGTATAGSDYTAISGTLSWANGDTANKAFTVAITDDTVFEGNETINLALSNPTGGATLGAQNTAVLTIVDNETQPTISINDVSVNEGDSGAVNANFTATLSHPTTQTVTMDYQTLGQGATENLDYTPISGALTFNPGETAKPLTVAVLGDTLDEANEQFSILLFNAVNAGLLDQDGFGTILDDDTAGSVQFANATYSVNEGNTTATITVSRTGGAASGVTVNYATSDGTATAGSDYTATNGTLTFAANEPSKTFAVTILDDNEFESDEAVNLSLSNPQGGGTLGAQATSVLAITETDTCSYSIAPTSQNFGVAGGGNTVTVTVINGCAWTAASNAAWITVTGGAAGNGNGTVNYTVAANIGAARTGTMTIAGQTFTVTQDAGQISVAMPTGLTAQHNAPVMVPVTVSDVSGRGATSYDFTVTYDPSVLTPQATPFDQVGTLSANFEINVNAATPGTLIVSGFGANPLSGSGTLLTLKFNASGNAPACSNLTFTAFTFNEGTPAIVASNGQACLINGNINGTISYGNATAFRPVPNTTLAAAGAVNLSTTTDFNGAYNLTGFGNGAYAVTPAKSNDVNGIASFDASQISRHVTQLITLSPQQLAAADVSGNGTVTSFDASLIARYILALPNFGSTGTWRFLPVNRSYTDVVNDYTAQDYTAILMGEVSGNWMPPAPPIAPELLPVFTAPETPATAVSVTAPMMGALPGASFTLPVTVGDLSGRGATSFDFDLLYNPAVIQPQTVAATNASTLSSGLLVGGNIITPGRLRVSGFGALPLQGAGTLVNLQFTALGAAGTTSPLTWSPFVFNEGDPLSAPVNGRVDILAPTGSSVTVSGYVLTQLNRAPRNAWVTLVDLQGNTRTARVNRFGYYEFADVETGLTYILTVNAKGYNFTPPNSLVTPTTNNEVSNFTAFPQY